MIAYFLHLVRKLFLVLLLIYSSVGVSQNYRQDSIASLLQNTTDQNKKALLYSQLSEEHEKTNMDSAIYYAEKGLEFSKKIDFQIGMAENAANLGTYYVTQNDLPSAKIKYSLAAQLFLESDRLFDYTKISMRLGNINLAQNNHIDALKLYQKCLDISKENNFTELIPHLYNNLGLIYLEFEDYEDAQSNFERAYKLFVENNDERSSVFALSNISLIQSILGNDIEAINGYLDVLSIHLKQENWVSLAFVYNAISEIYLKNKDHPRAKEYLNMALSAIDDKEDSFNYGPSSLYKVGIYTNAAELYFSKNDLKKAKYFAQKALQLSIKNSYKENAFKNAKIIGMIYDRLKKNDSALVYFKTYIEFRDQFQNEYDVKKLTKMKMQNDFDEILRKNEIKRVQEESKFKQKELKYLGITVFTILMAIILIQLYINQKTKASKLSLVKEKLELEKNELNLDLEYKKKELASNMMYLMEKNEFITSIARKLIELKPDAKKDNKETIQQIINGIKQNSISKIWEEFELRFKEVHTEFYDELNKAYPNLTPNEIKICAFLRLNMSTKEIAAITHQTTQSINMARFRLRKKLNIEREENLIAFLNSL